MQCYPLPPLTDEDIERFCSKVAYAGDDECWPWCGTVGNDGYGIFKLGGSNRRAHRVAYQIANGAVPSDLLICHTCDNRLCVRPSHLWTGTVKENALDMVAKGRHNSGNKAHPELARRGERHAQAKLTDMQVEQVKSLVGGTLPRGTRGPYEEVVAREFGISVGYLRHLRRKGRMATSGPHTR